MFSNNHRYISCNLLKYLLFSLYFRYNAARMYVSDRVSRVTAVVESLEREMELLCVTGVEDKLQNGVRTTLELLRNAGIKARILYI